MLAHQEHKVCMMSTDDVKFVRKRSLYVYPVHAGAMINPQNKARPPSKRRATMAFDRAGFERAVGILLQAARQKRGMTQEQLAEAISVPRASYANLEAGRQRIPVDIIWRVAVVLGVSVVSLLPEPSYRPKQEPEGNVKRPTDTSGTTALDLVTIAYRPAVVS